jgi:hypothetical protein
LGLWDHFVASRSSEGLAAALPQAQPLGRHAELEDERLGSELGERHILSAKDGLRAVLEGALGLPSLDRSVFADE